MVIKSGDSVLVMSPDEKTYLVTVAEGKRMGTHLGDIELGKAIGLEYGSTIKPISSTHTFCSNPL